MFIKKTFIKKMLLGFSFMLLVFFACSCKKNESKENETLMNGNEASWQSMTVLIPDGMQLVGGSALDPSDPNTAWIERKDDKLSYFLINIVSAEAAESTLKTTKELNSADDVSFKSGMIQWQGVKYKYAGVTDCFQVYGTLGNKTMLVSGSRFAVDAPEASTVLATIRLDD